MRRKKAAILQRFKCDETTVNLLSDLKFKQNCKVCTSIKITIFNYTKRRNNNN